MFRLLLILHNLSSRPINLVGNGLVWSLRCWHDMQPAEETATVKSSSSVVCCQQYAEMVEAADFNIPEIGCTGKISSSCASNKCSVRTRFFRLLKLKAKAKAQILGIAPLNMRSTCQRRFTIVEVVTDRHWL